MSSTAPMNDTSPVAAAISVLDRGSLWSLSDGPTWTDAASPPQGLRQGEVVHAPLLADEPAHHEDRGSRRTLHRGGRCGEPVEHDTVADIADLPPAAHERSWQDLLVLATLDEDDVGPRAAPSFEEPPQDIGDAAVVT